MHAQRSLDICIIYPGKRSVEEVYKTLRVHFAQPIQREFLDIGLAKMGKNEFGERSIGADVSGVWELGAWFICGVVLIKEAPEACRALNDLLNDVRTDQVLICWTLYEDLMSSIRSISGRHGLSCIEVQRKAPHVQEEVTRESRHYAEEDAKEHLRNAKEMNKLMKEYAKVSKHRDTDKAEAIRKKMGALEERDDKLMEKSVVLIIT